MSDNTPDTKISSARKAAWDIHVARVEDVVNQHMRVFHAGHPLPAMAVAPPTDRHEQIIQKAIDHEVKEAVTRALHRSIREVIIAIDEIDQSGNRRAKVTRLARQALQSALNRLQELKQDATNQDTSYD